MTILSSDYLRIMLGSCSDGRRIVFILAEAIQGFSAEVLNSEFRGRRSIWCSWRVTLVAPRIVNNVSYVTLLNHEIHFSWQVQYLVKLEDDLTPVAPLTVNDISYVMRIIHKIPFAWQAQYLLKLEADSCCSAQCK